MERAWLREATWEGALDLRNGAVSEKTPQFFDLRCPLNRYVAAFSRTEDPEVRCDLTNRRRHGGNPRCACAPSVN